MLFSLPLKCVLGFVRLQLLCDVFFRLAGEVFFSCCWVWLPCRNIIMSKNLIGKANILLNLKNQAWVSDCCSRHKSHQGALWTKTQHGIRKELHKLMNFGLPCLIHWHWNNLLARIKVHQGKLTPPLMAPVPPLSWPYGMYPFTASLPLLLSGGSMLSPSQFHKQHTLFPSQQDWGLCCHLKENQLRMVWQGASWAR